MGGSFFSQMNQPTNVPQLPGGMQIIPPSGGFSTGMVQQNAPQAVPNNPLIPMNGIPPQNTGTSGGMIPPTNGYNFNFGTMPTQPPQGGNSRIGPSVGQSGSGGNLLPPSMGSK